VIRPRTDPKIRLRRDIDKVGWIPRVRVPRRCRYARQNGQSKRSGGVFGPLINRWLANLGRFECQGLALAFEETPQGTQ